MHAFFKKLVFLLWLTSVEEIAAAQLDTSNIMTMLEKNLTPERMVIQNPRSALIKRQNIAVDTLTNTVVLSVKSGVRLQAFNPEFIAPPTGSVAPFGPHDFSNRPVNYVVTVNGKPSAPFHVLAKEYHNPVIEGYYADPEILYAQQTKKFYLYPTSDGFKEWSGTYFKAFSSTDLVNWKDEGVILDLSKDVKWAKIKAWAPCIIEKKTNSGYIYYYYFVAEKKIGVATANNPLGPFADMGKPLIEERPEGLSRGSQIDPAVFSDPKTNRTYLYWGNYYLAGAELNDDMVSIKKASAKLLTPDTTYREGTYVFYRKGKYYFMWSENDTRDQDYRVRYGIAESPLGRINVPENNLVIAKNQNSGIYATGHNAVIQIPGRDEWYIVYHRFNYPHGIEMGRMAGYCREICIDKLAFNVDGSIKQVTPTHEGIKPIMIYRQ